MKAPGGAKYSQFGPVSSVVKRTGLRYEALYICKQQPRASLRTSNRSEEAAAPFKSLAGRFQQRGLFIMVNGIGVLANLASVLLSTSPLQDVRGESKQRKLLQQ